MMSRELLEQEVQEVVAILTGKIDYKTINRLVDWIAQGEPLSEEEHAALRIRVIQMLCDNAQWYAVVLGLQEQDGMSFFHNQGYAGI